MAWRQFVEDQVSQSKRERLDTFVVSSKERAHLRRQVRRHDSFGDTWHREVAVTAEEPLVEISQGTLINVAVAGAVLSSAELARPNGN